VPRTIIYSRPVGGEQPQDEEGRIYAGTTTSSGSAEEVISTAGDGLSTRLTKYIPGETLAFVLPFCSVDGVKDGHVVGAVAVGALGQVLWLHHQGSQLATTDRPTFRFYLFALVAYAAWVLGTVPHVHEICRIDQTTAALILLAAAYLLPLIDPKTHEIFDPAPPLEYLTR
jgi:hypothetical protein